MQEFVFQDDFCLDYISDDSIFRKKLADLVTSSFQSELGVKDIVFREPGMVSFRTSDMSWFEISDLHNEVEPNEDGQFDFFGSIVTYFKPPYEPYDEQTKPTDITFRTKILVVDSRGKKVFKKASTLHGVVDVSCSTAGSSWLTMEDFKELITQGISDASVKKAPKRDPFAISCN